MKATLRNTVFGATSIAALFLSACENLPGTREEQAAVIGGAAGAVVGGSASDSIWGALLGGAAGAAGGYLIGANTDWFEQDPEIRSDQASTAIEEAQRNPASPEDARNSTSADLNSDGFVTTDELVAMEDAGLSDEEILERLEATGQVFDLSDEQRENFIASGLSPNVVEGLENINRNERESILSNPEIIGQPA